MPHWFFIPFLFAIGACIGSFLNVLVYRLPHGLSLTTPSSHCPNCKTPLAWRDNIPVFGWILLGGKCRYCKKPISPVYPHRRGHHRTAVRLLLHHVLRVVSTLAPNRGNRERWPHLWALYGSDQRAHCGKPDRRGTVHHPRRHSLVDRGAGDSRSCDHRYAEFCRFTHWSRRLRWHFSRGQRRIGLIISIVLLQMKILPLSFPRGKFALEIGTGQFERWKRRVQKAGRSRRGSS